eukprot:28828_1
MSTRNKRKIQKIDENVMRRKLLRMDTKTLMKHCKSKNIKHYGSRGEIVNRLIKKSKNNTKQNKNNRKTKKEESKTKYTFYSYCSISNRRNWFNKYCHYTKKET